MKLHQRNEQRDQQINKDNSIFEISQLVMAKNQTHLPLNQNIL